MNKESMDRLKAQLAKEMADPRYRRGDEMRVFVHDLEALMRYVKTLEGIRDKIVDQAKKAFAAKYGVEL